MRKIAVGITCAVILVLLPGTSWGDNPHRVQRGDTLSEIAGSHSTTVKRLRRLNPRKIDGRSTIYPGQRLRTHGKAKGKPKRRHARRCHRTWPVPGRTVYTYPGHDGVDINRGSGWDDYGDPIRAAACGRTEYVGWGRGYGLAVFQRLRVNGRVVVYGHLSSERTHAGERLRAGELIGRVGSTGNSTAPHLHFGFPGGTYRGALNFLLGGGAGGFSQFLHTETLRNWTPSPFELAQANGSGIQASFWPGAPRTEAPWSVKWRKIAFCESSLRWHLNSGNGYYGGLQFWPATWREHGGGQFAKWPHRATRREQKIVAERVLHGVQGVGAWPVCGVRGL